MNPIGSANKFLAEAIEEYGLDDYLTACETEANFEAEFGIDLDDEFGLDLGFIADAAKFITDNKENIQTGLKIAKQGSDLAKSLQGNAVRTTQKGRKRASRGEARQQAASSSPALSPQQKRNEMIKGKVEQIQGHLQMSLGECVDRWELQVFKILMFN